MGAAETRARGRSALRPDHRPPLPPRHGIRALAFRQGSAAVHVRPARARASPVGAQRSVRPMSLLFETPLIEGLAYREDFINEADQRELLGHLMPLELARFRFHGWLGNRKTRSFGWRY